MAWQKLCALPGSSLNAEDIPEASQTRARCRGRRAYRHNVSGRRTTKIPASAMSAVPEDNEVADAWGDCCCVTLRELLRDEALNREAAQVQALASNVAEPRLLPEGNDREWPTTDSWTFCDNSSVGSWQVADLDDDGTSISSEFELVYRVDGPVPEEVAPLSWAARVSGQGVPGAARISKCPVVPVPPLWRRQRAVKAKAGEEDAVDVLNELQEERKLHPSNERAHRQRRRQNR